MLGIKLLPTWLHLGCLLCIAAEWVFSMFWNLNVQPVPSYVSKCNASFWWASERCWISVFRSVFSYHFLYEVTLVKSKQSVKDSLIHERKAVTATDQIIDTAVPRLSNDLLNIPTISPYFQRRGHPGYLAGEVLWAFLMRGNPEAGPLRDCISNPVPRWELPELF